MARAVAIWALRTEGSSTVGFAGRHSMGTSPVPELPFDMRSGPVSRYRIVTLLALFALAWQSLVAQVHRHPTDFSAGVARAAAYVTVSGGDAVPTGDPATCPICNELAHAGTYLSAASPTLPWLAATTVRAYLRPFVQWSRRDPSHAWDSRGPPLQLPKPQR